MLPDFLSPHDWLERQPLQASEQLFAVFSNVSAAKPFEAWRGSMPISKANPIWADTAYAEWDAVMPFVAPIAADSGFLKWVATTASRDWGWLAVSSASQELLAEHLRSLTQVLLPNGNAVFFRFWDGRFLMSILQSAEVDSAELLPVIGRCWINGQAVETGAIAQKTSKEFPWWRVPEALLRQLGVDEATTLINNLMQWLSEQRPDVFEAFSEGVLRSKVAIFLKEPDLPPVPKEQLLAYLIEEMQ
ncbi:DUF4123 domain-containing protein [Pseudomonas fluorescens]|uniref:DUF4123 domain-containing protein n=1 Tax=Pseudomonas fluorescens TaxID=294 RepID=A0A5E7NSN1_PSEFL|nr:DUF4123 domain-containing protein [Pseudomonas fluorescens]VVP39889.1 hypothetical protein PS854_04765 [Pseudomonas fluorescens]